MEFAKRLGFNKQNTLTGLYSCDYSFFHNLFLQCKEEKQKKFPHRFIYVGRYYDFKGVTDLWHAFIDLQKEFPNEWELWCLGTGDVPPIVHPKIKHFGFVQPKDMQKFIAECGVFVLPSRFEPWGVAVHEFASAGFPLLCSDEVGAAEMFLKNNENGFMFKAKNILQLKNVMKKIISLSDDKLFSMGEMSAELAKQITPDRWADTLFQIANNKPRH
jgi:glycosyltransferase involved in cell wall biosynthesis